MANVSPKVATSIFEPKALAVTITMVAVVAEVAFVEVVILVVDRGVMDVDDVKVDVDVVEVPEILVAYFEIDDVVLAKTGIAVGLVDVAVVVA
jgi:hypothetical protein